MDHCTSHDTYTISNEFQTKNCDIVFIPKRMTNILPPLDRAINFPFKKYLKAKFTEFMLMEDIKKEDEIRIRIIADIVDVWNRYIDITIKNEYIPKDLVIKSFKITGISNLMDGSEDDKFDGFYLINKLSDLN